MNCLNIQVSDTIGKWVRTPLKCIYFMSVICRFIMYWAGPHRKCKWIRCDLRQYCPHVTCVQSLSCWVITFPFPPPPPPPPPPPSSTNLLIAQESHYYGIHTWAVHNKINFIIHSLEQTITRLIGRVYACAYGTRVNTKPTDDILCRMNNIIYVCISVMSARLYVMLW